MHLIRNILKYVPRREREQVARDLKPIYTAKDADQAQAELEAFDEKWGERFPVITQAWLNAWEYVTPFLAFPEEVRRVIYTTNAIEALNRQLRKAIKTKGSFPTEDSAGKLVYLALQNAVPQWTRTRSWTTALLAFKIHFGAASPTLQTDCHRVDTHGVTVTLSIKPPTQLTVRPRPGARSPTGAIAGGACLCAITMALACAPATDARAGRAPVGHDDSQGPLVVV